MTTLKEAFAEGGMRATYKGQTAIILPIDQATYAAMGAAELSKVGQGVAAGNMLVSWTEDGQRRGSVLDAFAGNDLAFKISRTDGQEGTFNASNITNAVKRLIEASREDIRERKALIESNAKLKADHEAAIAAGEKVEEPVYGVPTYADGAFAKIPALTRTIQASIAAAVNDGWADIREKSELLMAAHELGKVQANSLTREEMAKVAEARALRQAIGEIKGTVKAELGPYEAEDAGLAAREAVEALEIQGRGFSDVQMAALAGNSVIRKEVFSVLTTTDVHDLTAMMLDHQDFRLAQQTMARFEEKNWAPEAIGNIRKVLADRIPGYDFDARVYTTEGADVMLVRDHVGCYLYSWDSASRVPEIDVNGKILQTASENDVPSDEQLEALRTELKDLRYDNGAEIDFGWTDAKEAEALDPDLDFTAGPRPEGA
ncbi:hypothetical protein ACEUZ9_000488 [Paracoccus litorisediminis]